MTPPQHTFYLSLLGLSLQGYPISQTLYLGSHAHGGQDDNLPQRLYLMSHGHSHQGYPNFQTLYLGSRKHSLQGELLTLSLESHIHSLRVTHLKSLWGHKSSLQGDSLPDPEPWVTCPESPV